MIFNSNQFSNVIVYNSITNTLNDDKFDSNQPFSFIEFLNFTKSLSNNILQYTDYQVYLKKWNGVTVVKYNDINTVIKQQFVSFLKTIALNYTTVEEKKYLNNIDFEDTNDLEIAAPFFTSKIKQVLLYFAEKRDTYAIDLELAKNKGSVYGVDNYIKTTIVETIFGNDLIPEIITTKPLSTINFNLQVEVEEGYDIYNNYFDLDPFEAPSFYNADGDRYKYFSSNTNNIDSTIFVNYEQAIIDLINSEKVVLNTLQDLVVNIGSPNLNLLQNYDFINYDERTRNNLRLILDAQLIKKFTGTDFYYYTTSTTGVILSGVLFEATSPFANLLNVNNPSTLTTPQSSVLYERDVGLFFKPTHQSILQLQTPFSYQLKTDIKPDIIYIFPNPNEYGNIVGMSKTDHETPYSFIQQGELIQKNISSNNAIGNSFVTKNDFTFESYHSSEQNSVKSVAEELYNTGVINSYVSDIFGNIYIGLKQQNSPYIKNFYQNNIDNNVITYGLSSVADTQYVENIKSLINTGTFTGTQSVSSSGDSTQINTIYNTRNSTGKFLVYNVLKNTISPLSSEYTAIITKLQTEIPELICGMFSYEVYATTFVITTSAHTVIDKINYSDGIFYDSLTVPLILQNTVNYKCSNVYLVNNNIFVAKVSLTDSITTSGYNSREFILSLKSYDTNNGIITPYTFSPTSSTYSYNLNLSSYDFNTLVNVTNVSLIYNKKQSLFNIVITLKDLNNNLFLHSLFLRISNNVVTLVKQNIFRSLNTNFTINFFDGSYVNKLLLNSSLSSTPLSSTSNGTITL